MKKGLLVLTITLAVFSFYFLAERAEASYRCVGNPGVGEFVDVMSCLGSCKAPNTCAEVVSGPGPGPGPKSGGASRYKASDYYPYNTLPPKEGPIQDVGQLLGTSSYLIMWAQIVFWTLAVVFGLYSAYLYLFSGGDPEKTKGARNMLIYTVVAIAVAILAYGLPTIVANLLGAG